MSRRQLEGRYTVCKKISQSCGEKYSQSLIYSAFLAETPESEDLPLYERYTRLRSMIRCKDIGLKKACFCILPLRQFFYFIRNTAA